jgi:alkanesulfonate monooxygenase SsuD/methylene tetrahydromethanopterin reductase-like flavin-dependent oxidoreductase (luciferase family)/predicted kinase
MAVVQTIPDPALVVLIGASASGKTTWAQQRYRVQEIVSSDELRGIVGSGRSDLDATTDAFALLDQIVAARVRRGLTCVVDTLGLEPVRRRAHLALAKEHGMPTVAVLFDVPDVTARQRNALRERPVPAPALRGQLARTREVADEVETEGWDVVVRVASDAPAQPATRLASPPVDGTLPRFVLQVSRFPWGEDPAAWLRDVALAAEVAGFGGRALMDHLIQIPQVDRAWAPIPEPWVTLGMLAGLDTRLQLGTLVSPVTFRPPGVLAKAAATLDVLSGGRAFVGIGAGWWQREHDAYGLALPSAGERLAALERAVQTMRALWAPGTKPAAGLPETTCYPRPAGDIPIVVGGSGVRTLALTARLGSACNIRVDEHLPDRIASYQRHCAAAGTHPEVTVLDIPVTGRDRDEVWSRVEALRGNRKAAAFAKAHAAGTHAEQRERYARLAELGVSTFFVALPYLRDAGDVLAAQAIIP